MRDRTSNKGTRRIIQVLDNIKEAIEKHTKAQSSHNESQKEKGNIPAEVRAEIRFDNQTVRDAATDKNADRRIQNSIKRAAWSAFFAAAIYAGIAACQTYWARQATLATQKQLSDFEAVEAAQISVEFTPNTKIDKYFVEDGRQSRQQLLVNGTIDVSNIGQTAAVNLTAVGWNWGHNLKRPPPGTPGVASTVGSATSLDISGVLLGSGKTQRFPVAFGVPQVEEIQQGSWESGLYVDFTYSDVFGRSYSGHDCFMVNHANVLEFIRCPKPTTMPPMPIR